MRKAIRLAAMLTMIVTVGISSFGFKNEGEKTVADFKLLNVNGKMISLKDYSNAKGLMVVFTCNHCPFAKLYPKRLNSLNKKYKPLGVPLIAISSTDTILYEEDMYPRMVATAKADKINFPYLYDGTQKVAKDFAAQKTPHAFLIWKEKDQWVIKYSGAIDDNGMEPKLVQKHLLANAVDAMLHGQPIEEKETKSIGCQIMFRK